jgi:hypothetical protein
MRSAQYFAELSRLTSATRSHDTAPFAQSAAFQPVGPGHPVGPGDVFEGAILFRQLRHLVQLPFEQIAYHLGTSIEVLQALESGSTRHLPPWPETVRVVTGYTAFASIDPRPVLSAIHAAMVARDEAMRRVAATGPSAILAQPSVRQPHTRPWAKPTAKVKTFALIERARVSLPELFREVWRSDAVKSLKTTRVIAALSVTLPLAILLSWASGGPSNALASVIPKPVAGFITGIENFVRHSLAPRRDGLAWIEVVDPRERRTDKLPSPRR